jgi:hypothetical protein
VIIESEEKVDTWLGQSRMNRYLNKHPLIRHFGGWAVIILGEAMAHRRPFGLPYGLGGLVLGGFLIALGIAIAYVPRGRDPHATATAAAYAVIAEDRADNAEARADEITTAIDDDREAHRND